ncbi:hypothetical protein [Cyanobacterium sp. Dongsha4]|uniref:hypothetical protein n=1 Tax=Cyanobacterium sp. DS4 TaxID=2878255 RepID=UPI000F28302D|nr:hypothetical protein [Cyanobacterium sp. Dongsha4]RMD72885.1 MAG: hypothetical protein D6822_00565 [Cyanobacteria bacterium J149]WVL01957.1 hypothetical protein Dongsha4_07160 [Cyanobacterium sp. Dongsha4]
MKLTFTGIVSLGLIFSSSLFVFAQNRNASFSGTVERVWEDGFQLKTDSRSLSVDSYSVCGDKTPQHIQVGDQVTVTGELEILEFDAFSIIKNNNTKVCQS